jgi:septal ring factor EnvC (AmiA/AmiB activator)
MRKNLSQQKLLEILIAEIEILQQTSKNIKEVAPEIARQLHDLKTAKIKFDLNTDKLEELLNNHKRELKKFVVIPKWFLALVGVVIVIMIAYAAGLI